MCVPVVHLAVAATREAANTALTGALKGIQAARSHFLVCTVHKIYMLLEISCTKTVACLLNFTLNYELIEKPLKTTY